KVQFSKTRVSAAAADKHPRNIRLELDGGGVVVARFGHHAFVIVGIAAIVQGVKGFWIAVDNGAGFGDSFIETVVLIRANTALQTRGDLTIRGFLFSLVDAQLTSWVRLTAISAAG